jgi:hypothetical protein
VKLLDGSVAVRRLLDVVAGFGHRLCQAAAQRIVVVGNQNPSHTAIPRSRQLQAVSPE